MSKKLHLNELFLLKKNEIYYHSPFSFIRSVNPDELIYSSIIAPFNEDISRGRLKIKEISVDGNDHYFLMRYLAWDSNYFKFPHYRIELILCEHTNAAILNAAIKIFLSQITEKNAYVIFEVPCENLYIIQAFANTKFKLIETRLHFFYSMQDKILNEQRYPIRKANVEDIPALKYVARKMRNKFDRVHADPAYSDEVADEYIAQYIEECVKGFSDFVFVPDLPEIPAAGFFAGRNPKNINGINVSKLLITAVDKDSAKGWLQKIQSESLYYLAGLNTDYIVCNTQASNKPSMFSLYNSGFRLGRTTHIFTYHDMNE
jgi:dTDP-4-amino-4,6-dideoxy-D-galactose acyltransferase